MDESTRNMWISTLHHGAAIKQMMQKITNTIRQTKKQHVEFGK